MRGACGLTPPSRSQKIVVSKKWGFSPYNREEYIQMRKEGKLKVHGNVVQYLPKHGRLPEVEAV